MNTNMKETDQAISHRILLVDDDDGVRKVTTLLLEYGGFAVVAAATVKEALSCIASESFDVLVTDLHMPNPGDGFTVVSAMRHSQPEALTLIVSGYPDVQGALAAILLEADGILVKPFEVATLAELVRGKLLNRAPVVSSGKERVSVILRRCIPAIVAEWLARAKQSKELNSLSLTDGERTGHLAKLVEDLSHRLSESGDIIKMGDTCDSSSAAIHGRLRYEQGYTPPMLVHESRILQVTIFGTLQSNLNQLDFSLLLPDVMTIADEVDSQLTQSMDSYMKVMQAYRVTAAIAS